MGTVSSKFLEIANVINQLTKEEKIEEAQKLEHENQHLLDERRDQLSQVEIALDVKASIKLHIIERRILPDTISGKQIYGITRILE